MLKSFENILKQEMKKLATKEHLSRVKLKDGSVADVILDLRNIDLYHKFFPIFILMSYLGIRFLLRDKLNNFLLNADNGQCIMMMNKSSGLLDVRNIHCKAIINKVNLVNDVEVEAPLDVIHDDDICYTIDFEIVGMSKEIRYNSNCIAHVLLFRNQLLFKTEDGAREMARAMMNYRKGNKKMNIIDSVEKPFVVALLDHFLDSEMSNTNEQAVLENGNVADVLEILTSSPDYYYIVKDKEYILIHNFNRECLFLFKKNFGLFSHKEINLKEFSIKELIKKDKKTA